MLSALIEVKRKKGMKKFKNIITIIIAIALICICSYELHIIPRNGIGLTASIFKRIEICEIVLVVSLLIISLTEYRSPKVTSSQLGTIFKVSYVVLSYALIAIAMYSNSSKPISNRELNETSLVILLWIFMLAIISIGVAIEVGKRAISLIFAEKKIVKGFLE